MIRNRILSIENQLLYSHYDTAPTPECRAKKDVNYYITIEVRHFLYVHGLPSIGIVCDLLAPSVQPKDMGPGYQAVGLSCDSVAVDICLLRLGSM